MSIFYAPPFVARRFLGRLRLLAAALLFITPLCVSGQEYRFAGLYVPGRAGAEPRCDLTFAELTSDLTDPRRPTNQQILSIDGYDNGARYCVTYTQSDDASAVYRDNSLRDLAERIQAARADMGLTDLEFVSSRGRMAYLSVWRSGAASGELVADLEPAEFGVRVKALNRDGMRIAALAVSAATNTPRITAFFVRSPRQQNFLISKDRDAFQNAHDKNVNNGMAMVDFDVYDSRATRFLIGVWQETSGAGRFVQNMDWRTFLATFNASTRESLQLVKIRAYPGRTAVDPGAPGTDPVTTTTPEPDDVVVGDTTGTDPGPITGDDPTPDPGGSGNDPVADDQDPVADDQDTGSGGGTTSGQGGGGFASFATRFGGYCRVHTLSINTCAESMGRSPAHIAAQLHTLQTASGRSCCEAIDIAQAQFGGNGCQVVNRLVREKYACD